MSPWIRVSRLNRCPICEHDSWCSVSQDGATVWCMRAESPRQVECAIGFGWIHKVSGAGHGACRDVRTGLAFTSHRTSGARPDFDAMLAEWRRDARLQSYAASLGVSEESLRRLGATHAPPHRALAFPMRSADGDVIGIRLRGEDGRKWAVKGSNGSGMFFCENLSAVPALADNLPATEASKKLPDSSLIGEARESAENCDRTGEGSSMADSRGGTQTLKGKEGLDTSQLKMSEQERSGDVKCEQSAKSVEEQTGYTTTFPTDTTTKDMALARSKAPSNVQPDGGATRMFFGGDLTAVQPLAVQARPIAGAAETLLICEGPTDTAAALSLGYAAIGLPQAHASEMFYALLRRLRPREIVVVLDGDEHLAPDRRPGRRAATEICRRFKRAKNVVLPTKDLRELMSAALLRSLIANVKV